LITAEDLQALIRAAEAEWVERQLKKSGDAGESGGSRGVVPVASADEIPISSAVGSGDGRLEEMVSQVLCQLDEASTIVIGPGCNIHDNK
jgi:hypothetical protein